MNMFRTVIMTVAVFGVSASLTPALAKKARVCFYEHANYQGDRICARVGEAREALHEFNDVISSVRMRGRARVTVCEHFGFGGRCREIRGNTPFVGNRWNDRISAFQVARPGSRGYDEDNDDNRYDDRDEDGYDEDYDDGRQSRPERRHRRGGFPRPGSADHDPHRVCFYTNSKFRERRFCDRPRNRVNRLPRRWDNDIESISMFGNSIVRICSKPNLRGACHVYRRSQKRIGAAWMNNLSSYEIILE